ncbi:MAG: hypothetical protein K2H09_07165, partial [Treponemataceae bacterium]|nr:hypothetical protein [Treponemataceae bacterium]
MDSNPLSSVKWKRIQFSENQAASVKFERTAGRVFLVKCNSSDVPVAASKTGYVVGGGGASVGRVPRLAGADAVAPRLSEALSGSGGIPLRADFPPAVEFYERLKSWNGGAEVGAAHRRAAADGAVQSSCSPQADYFWTIENNQSRRLPAARMAVGAHCEVWFIDSTDAVSADGIDFQAVADKFDTIYELEAGVFGRPQYTAAEVHLEAKDQFILPDSGGKITILLLDIDADAGQQNASVVMGYFYAADMLSSAAASSMSVKTNGRELIYIDSYCMERYPKATYATLAHEFQHLLNFVQKTIRNGEY